MTFKTPDLCDQFEDRLGNSLFVLAPLFNTYGGRQTFSGQITTLKLFEDNTWVRTALAENGKGKVLVIDGGGSLRCALVGDQLGLLAQKNGWEGILVYGCIRDSADMAGLDIGLRALNTHPQKSIKKNVGEQDIPVTFGGVTFRPGHWLYADTDGVLISEGALIS